ncbi:MAG: hypothetical protein WBF09_20600 [Candidatus Acidiferrum sp.]
MRERANRAIRIVAAIAFAGAFIIGLACWTIATWDDKALLSSMFWMALGFVGFHAERGN